MKCWAGLPPVVLDPNVLDKRVGTDPIVTHLGLACAQTIPPFANNFGHLPMAGEAAMEKLWQADVIIIKEARLPLDKINKRSLIKMKTTTTRNTL